MDDRHYDGLAERVVRVETQLKDVRDDVRELRQQDVKEIKRELRALHDEFGASQKGMSRPEKIALAAAFSAVVGTIVGVIALLSAGPTP